MPDESTVAELKRVLEAGNEREAASFAQRHGAASLAACLDSFVREAPHDAWLLDMLCRELWRQGDLPGLDAALQRPAAGDAAAMKDAWQVLRLAKTEDREALSDGLGRIVRLQLPHSDFPAFLERELAPLRCMRELDQALEAAVAAEAIGMSFAGLFIRRACHRKQWDVRSHFPKWIERAGDDAVDPVAAFLEVIGDLHEAAAVVPELITVHGDWMKGRTRTYGKCGYALTNSGLFAEAAAWLQGCESRDDLQGWMAANQVTALWSLHRYQEAGKVAAAVLERDLRDSTWDWNAAAAAFGHALAGRAAETQAALSAITGTSTKNSEFVWAAELARSVLRALKLPRKESRRVFHEERQRLRLVLTRQSLKLDPDAASERYRMALSAIARHGRFWVWPWQRRLVIERSANPLLGRFWIGGVVLLLVAILRGCMAPQKEGDALFGQPANEVELPDEFKARPASDKEIERVLSAPQGRGGR